MSEKQRTEKWINAYTYAVEQLVRQRFVQDWERKFSLAALYALIMMSLFIGSLMTQLIPNVTLFKYVQIVLVTGAGIMWIKYIWTIFSGPEGPIGIVDVARVVELVDTGDLKSPDHLDHAGSSPAVGIRT